MERKIDKDKIIVCGTGRCGTGYMSKLLTMAGISCSHETFFTNNGISNQTKFSTDSSWLSVPYLKDYPDVFIIHAIREPIKTINSFLNIIFFDKQNRYYDFILKYLPELNNYKTSIDKAFYYILEWNDMIFKYQHSDRYYLFKVESDPVSLIDMLGGNTKSIFCNRKYNTRPKNQKIRLTDDDVPKLWRKRYFQLKNKVGYR